MGTAAPLPIRGPSSQSSTWTGTAIAVAALSAVAESAVVTAGALESAPISVRVAVHVGVCLSLGPGFMCLSPRSRGNPGFLLFTICTLAMGPLGAVGTALTMALRRSFALGATPFEEWYAVLFPKITATPTQSLFRRIVLRGGGPPKRSTVAPFLDIMALGTVQQKRVVIAMIADKFHSAFAPALRSALNDPEPAIRVQAATAVAYIESGFLNRSMTLQTKREECPDDAEIILELARHHEDCAESGLLDDGRAQAELTKALICCERVGEKRPGDPIVAESAARLLLRLGRTEEAMLRLQPLVARSDPSPEALANYFACLFRCGQFERLRDACRRFGDRIDLAALPNGFGEALRLWAGDTQTQTLPRTFATGGST